MKKTGLYSKSKKEIFDTSKDHHMSGYFFDYMIAILFENRYNEDSIMEEWKNASFII